MKLLSSLGVYGSAYFSTIQNNIFSDLCVPTDVVKHQCRELNKRTQTGWRSLFRWMTVELYKLRIWLTKISTLLVKIQKIQLNLFKDERLANLALLALEDVINSCILHFAILNSALPSTLLSHSLHQWSRCLWCPATNHTLSLSSIFDQSISDSQALSSSLNQHWPMWGGGWFSLQ